MKTTTIAVFLVLLVTNASNGKTYSGNLIGLGQVPAISGASPILDIDPFSGAVSNIRSTGQSQLIGLASDNVGKLYSITTFGTSLANSLFEIEVATGQAHLIGPTGLTSIFEGGLSFNPTNGLLYGVQNVPTPPAGPYDLFTVNTDTGLATILGSLPSSSDYSAIAFDSDGRLFALDTSEELLHEVNPLTASILSTKTLSQPFGPAAGMTFHPVTDELFVADGDRDDPAIFNLYTLDVDTGNLNVVGPTRSHGIRGLVFIIPEPSTYTLALAALCLLSACRRR